MDGQGIWGYWQKEPFLERYGDMKVVLTGPPVDTKPSLPTYPGATCTP